MDFWAGLLVGIAGSFVSGGLAIAGVIIANKAARRREEEARQSEQQIRYELKRGERMHVLRRALSDLARAVRRAEAEFDRGLTIAADIDLDDPLRETSLSLGLLEPDRSEALVGELERAYATMQAGGVYEGAERFDDLIRYLMKWTIFSREPLEVPPPSVLSTDTLAGRQVAMIRVLRRRR